MPGFERVDDTSSSVLETDDFDGTFEEFAASFKSARTIVLGNGTMRHRY